MKRITFFSRFFQETRFTWFTGCLVIAGAMIQTVSAQTTFTAVAGNSTTTVADINALTTWSATSAIPLPIAGDANIWSTGTFYIRAGSTETFNGGTLNVATGGTLASGAAGPTLTLNNLTLNGGRIYDANNSGLTLTFQGKTLTLNNGYFVTSSTLNTTAMIKLQNCALAGSGNITIAETLIDTLIINEHNTELTSTGVTTSGFSGVFTVSPGTVFTKTKTGTSHTATVNGYGATLKISAPTSGTFGVSIPASDATNGVVLNGVTYKSIHNGKLWFNPGTGNTCTLASLKLGGHEIAPGTYAYADFAIADTVYLNKNSTGTITIPAIAPNPPANVVATNVNGVASVAFTGVATSFTIKPYDVTTSTTGTPVIGTTSPILIPGLTNADNYTFTVTATSVSGTSAASSASNQITITVPGTVTAISGANTPITNIYDTAAWPAENPIPVKGDANTWSTGAFKLYVSTTPYTFNGTTLEVVNGGSLAMNTGSSMLYLNNVMLNGLTGIIQNQSGFNATLDLQGKTFTLNNGSLKTLGTADPSVTPKDLLIQNCSLAGSGTISIAQIQTGAFYCNVEFLPSVNTTGFTGTINVAPGLSGTAAGGTLKLNSSNYSSFGVKVLAADPINGVSSNSAAGTYKSSANGKLYFTAGTGTILLSSLNLGGTDIANGTYSYADFANYFGVNLQGYLNSNSTGKIKIAPAGTAGLNQLIVNNLVKVKDKGFLLYNIATSLQVYNMLGVCIIDKQNVNTNTFITVATTGVYLVKAKTEEGISVQKIMIK